MRDHRYDPNPINDQRAAELDLERRLAEQDISARMHRAAPRIVLSAAQQQRRRDRGKAAKAARKRNRGQ